MSPLQLLPEARDERTGEPVPVRRQTRIPRGERFWGRILDTGALGEPALPEGGGTGGTDLFRLGRDLPIWLHACGTALAVRCPSPPVRGWPVVESWMPECHSILPETIHRLSSNIVFRPLFSNHSSEAHLLGWALGGPGIPLPGSRPGIAIRGSGAIRDAAPLDSSFSPLMNTETPYPLCPCRKVEAIDVACQADTGEARSWIGKRNVACRFLP